MESFQGEQVASLKQIKSLLKETVQKSGVLNTVKAQLRREVISGLSDKILSKPNAAGTNNGTPDLRQRQCMSIVYHFLRQRNLQHSLSVFTAECGLDSKSAWLSELDIVQSLRFGSNSKVYREILERESSEISTANYSVFDVLLDHFCSDVKRGTAEVGVQTESSTSGLGPREFLDTQVSELRRAFLLRRDAERDAPLRTVEERMLSFQRECEERYRRETEAYASYLKETEIAKVRLEEAEKARVEIEKLKGQLDTDYQRRLNEQAEREAASLRSMADRERQLQQTQYEARQKLQREIDDLRAREKASVRRFELETQGLQTLELRLKEAKILLESREREALNREREAEERLKNSLDLARAEARNSLRAELEDLSRERGALKLERQRLDDDRSSQEALLESANTTRRMLREAQAALLEKDDKISILTKQVEALMAAAREEEEANESFFDASNTYGTETPAGKAHSVRFSPRASRQLQMQSDATLAHNAERELQLARAESARDLAEQKVASLTADLENAKKEIAALKRALSQEKAIAMQDRQRLKDLKTLVNDQNATIDSMVRQQKAQLLKPRSSKWSLESIDALIAESKKKGAKNGAPSTSASSSSLPADFKATGDVTADLALLQQLQLQMASLQASLSSLPPPLPPAVSALTSSSLPQLLQQSNQFPAGYAHLFYGGVGVGERGPSDAALLAATPYASPSLTYPQSLYSFQGRVPQAQAMAAAAASLDPSSAGVPPLMQSATPFGTMMVNATLPGQQQPLHTNMQASTLGSTGLVSQLPSSQGQVTQPVPTTVSASFARDSLDVGPSRNAQAATVPQQKPSDPLDDELELQRMELKKKEIELMRQRLLQQEEQARQEKQANDDRIAQARLQEEEEERERQLERDRRRKEIEKEEELERQRALERQQQQQQQDREREREREQREREREREEHQREQDAQRDSEQRNKVGSPLKPGAILNTGKNGALSDDDGVEEAGYSPWNRNGRDVNNRFSRSGDGSPAKAVSPTHRGGSKFGSPIGASSSPTSSSPSSPVREVVNKTRGSSGDSNSDRDDDRGVAKGTAAGGKTVADETRPFDDNSSDGSDRASRGRGSGKEAAKEKSLRNDSPLSIPSIPSIDSATEEPKKESSAKSSPKSSDGSGKDRAGDKSIRDGRGPVPEVEDDGDDGIESDSDSVKQRKQQEAEEERKRQEEEAQRIAAELEAQRKKDEDARYMQEMKQKALERKRLQKEKEQREIQEKEEAERRRKAAEEAERRQASMSLSMISMSSPSHTTAFEEESLESLDGPKSSSSESNESW